MPQSTSNRAKAHSAAKKRSAARSRDTAEPVDNVTTVYNELRSLIITGQLPPGARVAERAVVARTGHSRTPVRSALHRLQQEGLVASVGRPGDQRLIVTPLTDADGHEVFLLEGHLEGLAARQAASLPLERRQQLAHRLREINRGFAAAARTRTAPAKLFSFDHQFHETFVEAASGPRLLALHGSLRPQSERYARLYVGVLLADLPNSVKEHEAIAAAIAKGNRAAAQRAAERNWMNAARRLAKVIVKQGERGTRRPAKA
ncbi:MAG TPA: GntR family transcriptional regulator [Gemmatimonadaceae bacterium]